MEGINPLFLVVAGAGLVMVIARLVPLLVGTIDAAAFDSALEKLLAAGNRDRALKLCAVVTGHRYGAVVGALVTKSQELSAREGEGLVHSALADTYQQAYDHESKRIRRFGFLAPLGVLLAAGASRIPLQVTDAPPFAPYLPAAVALLLAVAAWRKVKRFEADCQRGRNKMLPLLTDYVMRGGR